MRTVAEIDAEMSSIKFRLHCLKQERHKVVAERNERICTLYAAGLRQHEVALQVGVSDQVVANILFKCGQRKAHKPIKTFPVANQRAYHAAREQGVPPLTARQLAGCV